MGGRELRQGALKTDNNAFNYHNKTVPMMNIKDGGGGSTAAQCKQISFNQPIRDTTSGLSGSFGAGLHNITLSGSQNGNPFTANGPVCIPTPLPPIPYSSGWGRMAENNNIHLSASRKPQWMQCHRAAWEADEPWG